MKLNIEFSSLISSFYYMCGFTKSIHKANFT